MVGEEEELGWIRHGDGVRRMCRVSLRVVRRGLNGPAEIWMVSAEDRVELSRCDRRGWWLVKRGVQ